MTASVNTRARLENFSGSMGIRRFLTMRALKEDARELLLSLSDKDRSDSREYTEDASSDSREYTEDEESENEHEMDILHRRLLEVCQDDPMFFRVTRIVRSSPDAVKAVNSRLQTPLHVAAANGASTDTLLFLLEQYPEAATLVDMNGKTPLHYLAHSSFWTAQGRGVFWGSTGAPGTFLGPTYHEMVKALVKAYPGAATLEDEDGCNPIEYAIIHNTPLEIVRTIQRASVKLQQQSCNSKATGTSTIKSPPVAQAPLTKQDLNILAGRTA